jgi:hypothetical protein
MAKMVYAAIMMLALAIVLLLPLLLVPLVHATEAQTVQSDNQSQKSDSWRMWVFIYNVPPSASDIRLAIKDNNSDSNEFAHVVISVDKSVGNPNALTAMWADFIIPDGVIGNGTAYKICVSGDDIRSTECLPADWHNGTRTIVTDTLDWSDIPKADSNDDQSQSNDTSIPEGGYYHGHRV